MGDANMIFERNVEDPCPSGPCCTRTVSNINNGSGNGVGVGGFGSPLSPSSSNNGLSRHSTNVLSRCNTCATDVGSNSGNGNGNGNINGNGNGNSSHHNLENLISPALDASCSIVTDETTDLDDVNIMYSRRPSTIGLDMALGTYNGLSPSSSQNPEFSGRLVSPSSTGQSGKSYNYNQGSCSTSKLLKFYSYADMISDELNTVTPSTVTESHTPMEPNLQSIPKLLRTRSTSATLPQHFGMLNNNYNNSQSNTIKNGGCAPPVLRHTNTSPLFRARTYSVSTSFPLTGSNSRKSPSQYFIFNDDALSPLQTDKVGTVLRKKMSRHNETSWDN